MGTNFSINNTEQDLILGVVNLIHKIAQADLVILYPYVREENRYLSPIAKGTFIESASLKTAHADSAAIVHLVNKLDTPVFANDAATLYSSVGKGHPKEKKFPDKEGIHSVAAIPLKVGDEPIGVLFINYRTRQSFDDTQKWVMSSLATYGAIAIRNSRQYQELRLRRLNELEDLRQIDKEISGTLNSEKILNTILELTARHIKADTGIILLLNKKINAIEAKAAIGENLLPLDHLVFALDQFRGIAKTAFESKKSIRINNVRNDPEWKSKFVEISRSTISEMNIPLILEGEAIGVMVFESNREAAFTTDDERFMETLAGPAVIAIKNAIEYERAQRIAKEREALIDIVNVLLSQSDTKEIFSIILQRALEITETSKGSIKTCDEERRELRIVVANGIEKAEWFTRVQTFDEGITGRVAREKRSIRIDNISNHPLKAEYLKVFEGRIESVLAVPILDGKKIKGVIDLESENPYHFEDDDFELIESLSSLCAVALKTVESIHEKELASIGIITGDISHRMNSPLSKIQKQIELIEINCEDILNNNNYLANKIAEINNTVSETITMVQKRVNDAKRSFARIEKTSLKLCLRKALEEIEIPENISLEDHVTRREDMVEVLATPELTNVFHNLILNAIRAMPNGGKVSLNVESIDESWISISIEDTGKGIPENIAPLVFHVSDRAAEGHGFGLPLTKAYIEMVGGKIDVPVSGKDGKGAKFTIQLKRA